MCIRDSLTRDAMLAPRSACSSSDSPVGPAPTGENVKSDDLGSYLHNSATLLRCSGGLLHHPPLDALPGVDGKSIRDIVTKHDCTDQRAMLRYPVVDAHHIVRPNSPQTTGRRTLSSAGLVDLQLLCHHGKCRTLPSRGSWPAQFAGAPRGERGGAWWGKWVAPLVRRAYLSLIHI